MTWPGLGKIPDTCKMPDDIRKGIEQCRLSDGKIPLLDVNTLVTFHSGAKTIVEDGIYCGKGVLASNIAIGNMGTVFHLPSFQETAFQAQTAYTLGNGVAVDFDTETAFDGVEIARQLVFVDGKSFTNCRFDRCGMLYKGGPVQKFVGCNLDGCHWVFDDGAKETILWLHTLYHRFGEPGRRLVEQVFHDIQHNSPYRMAPSTDSPEQSVATPDKPLDN